MYIKYLHLTRLESLLYNRSGATQEHEQNESTHRLFSWTVNSDDIDKRLGWGLLLHTSHVFINTDLQRIWKTENADTPFCISIYATTQNEMCIDTALCCFWLSFTFAEHLKILHLDIETPSRMRYCFSFSDLSGKYIWRVNSGVCVRIHFLHLSICILTLTVDCKESDKWITCKIHLWHWRCKCSIALPLTLTVSIWQRKWKASFT